ncbi:MAG TPA: ion channel [Cyclobacteriaceae bacterium]|jgi:inward rectifier potassium channel|nr:ion channel [Cyclobacteriaceae bacterium]
MAKRISINPFSKVNNDTGFGNNPNSYGGRFVNRDGTFNVAKEGQAFWQRFSLFHTMLNLPLWKFIMAIIIFFIGINLLYTSIYILLGTNQFMGMIATTRWEEIKEIYFFSTETFTTVGYGRVNPIGDGANFVASIEAMSGFITFAIITGLIYGRFAKPKAFLAFSEHALVAPYRGKSGLMFRFVSFKDNHTLTAVEIKVNVALQVLENEKMTYKFYDLELERNRVDSLPMNWTVVHPIDEKSPLVGLSWEDMKNADLEIYVLVRGFDDVFSNFVLQRTSYTFDEIKINRKFVPMYRESDDGKTTIVEVHKLSEHIEVI